MLGRLVRTLVALATVALLTGTAGVGAETLYGALGTTSATSNLLILNPANGAVAATVGPIGYAVTGLAVHPTTGVLYGATSNNSAASPRSLIAINKQTGAGAVIGSFGIEVGDDCPNGLADLAFTADGNLYGWNENCNDNLHIVNLATGLATQVGVSSISTSGSGMSVSPGGVMYLAGDGSDGALRTVNPATGLTSAGPTLSGGPAPAGQSIGALAFNSAGVLYGVYINTSGVRPTHLIIINTGTGAITDLGSSANALDAIAFDNSDAPVVNPQIPTLNEWGLLLLSLMLMGAMYALKRRRA